MRLHLALAAFFILLYLGSAYAYFLRSFAKPLPNPNAFDKYQIINNKARKDGSLVYAALGDSLTAGIGVSSFDQTYVYRLAQTLSKDGNITLYDLGIPGAKTEDVIKKELPLVQSLRPNYVSLLIGLNDAMSLESPSTFRQNYQVILSSLNSLGTTKVIVISIPALSSAKTLYPPYNFLMGWRIRQFNSIISQLVKGKNYTYVDLYKATKTDFDKDPSLYSADNFHPGFRGYKIWGDVIDGYLNP